MAVLRVGVSQGKTYGAALAALLLASACSSSTVSFGPDPEPSAGSGSGGSASQAGKSNGTSGTNNDAGSTAQGGSGNEGGASGGSEAGGTESGGTASEGGSAGTSNGGATGGGGSGTAGEPTAGSGGSVSGGAGGSAGSGGSSGSGGTGEGGSGGYNGEPCTPGFYGGHTYQFCGAVDSAVAAFTKCQSLGMGVVSIESKAENTYVQGKQGTTWLGGTDEAMEGQWRWASTQALFWNEKPVPGVYQNFIDGQPNNEDKDGLPENCLLLSPSGWNDVGCALSGFKVTCESGGPLGPLVEP